MCAPACRSLLMAPQWTLFDLGLQTRKKQWIFLKDRLKLTDTPTRLFTRRVGYCYYMSIYENLSTWKQSSKHLTKPKNTQYWLNDCTTVNPPGTDNVAISFHTHTITFMTSNLRFYKWTFNYIPEDLSRRYP